MWTRYSPDGAQINSIVIDKKLSVDSKELKRTEEPPTVLTEEEAVDYVLEQNQSDDPLFNVTISAEKGSLKKIDAGKTYEESDELYKDESKVKSKGESGNQIVTDSVISVNRALLRKKSTRPLSRRLRIKKSPREPRTDQGYRMGDPAGQDPWKRQRKFSREFRTSVSVVIRMYTAEPALLTVRTVPVCIAYTPSSYLTAENSIRSGQGRQADILCRG